MSTLWPHWLRPGWLALAPVLIAVLWFLWQRERRSGRWQLLLPSAVHGLLLGHSSARKLRSAWWLLASTWFLAVLILLGPSWQRVEHSNLRRADPLVVVLNLSAAMRADDLLPSRLAQAKGKVRDLLALRGEAPTAVVLYAGSAHTLVPLTDDQETTLNLLDALDPKIMPEPGQRADLGVAKALTLLKDSPAGRIVLLSPTLSSAEEREVLKHLDGRDTPLDVLGVGTRQGAPIREANGELLRDAQGAIVLSKLDEPRLKQLARQAQGHYARLTLNDRDLSALQLDSQPQQLQQQGDLAQLSLWADQGYWLLLPLLLLAACAGRRGWLFIGVLLISLPQPSYAGWQDWWLTPDQQGARLLKQGQAAQAAERFKDAQWQGMALYQAGDYAAAAERFAQFNTAQAHYNRANALAKSGELAAALDAYDSALELNSNFPQAKSNRALVEQALKQQQQQNPQQQQSQDQSNNPANDSANQSDSGAPQEPANAAPKPANKTAEQKAAKASSSNTQSPQTPADKTSESAAQPAEQPSAGDSTKQTTETQANAADSSAEQAAQTARDEPALSSEQRAELEQWLKQIPDDPAELLRRKFWLEQQESRP